MRANSTSKALGGKASFLWATLAVFARWRNAEVSVDVDGEHREGSMLDVIVANCEWLGGGMHMTPNAKPDDGLFDVLLIGDMTKRDLVQTLPKIYRGTHLPHPKAEELRGATVRVDAETPLPVELDGEQPGTTPATFEVVPGALRLRVPCLGRRSTRGPCRRRWSGRASGDGAFSASFFTVVRFFAVGVFFVSAFFAVVFLAAGLAADLSPTRASPAGARAARSACGAP